MATDTTGLDNILAEIIFFDSLSMIGDQRRGNEKRGRKGERGGKERKMMKRRGEKGKGKGK